MQVPLTHCVEQCIAVAFNADINPHQTMILVIHQIKVSATLLYHCTYIPSLYMPPCCENPLAPGAG